MINSADFNRTNVREAFSVVLLANRDSVTKVEEENLDADTLFAYLKLEKYIPRNVFFTVELTCASNIAVLNSTMLGQDNAKHSSTSTSKSSSNLHHNPMSSQTKGTFTSQKKLSYAQAIRKKLNHDGRTSDTVGSVSLHNISTASIIIITFSPSSPYHHHQLYHHSSSCSSLSPILINLYSLEWCSSSTYRREFLDSK